MTKKSREIKKTLKEIADIRIAAINTITAIGRITAIKFITTIFNLEKKEIPKFERLNNDEILKIYSTTHIELMEKLVKHRHKPVDVEYLEKLRYINGGILSPSIKRILESLV